MDLFLQIFLMINIFLIGAFTATALRHGWAHLHPHPDEKPQHLALPAVKLPTEVREHLLEKAQANFQTVLDHSNAELERDLKDTVARLNGKLEKMGAEIVGDEMKRYRMDLDALRKQTEANISGAQTEITKHQTDLKSRIDAKQTELEAKMNEEVAAEKQVLIAQIDTKLADAVASFLTETLQHNVDLGAQSAYLISTLEEHKAELTKDINDET